MFRKLRRIWAHKSICKFLKEFLPGIGLGEFVEFKCLNFGFGEYSVKTTKGKYDMYFWELLDGAKEFYIDLNEKGASEFERITFSIIGNIKFKIIPTEFMIDREGKRQVTNLLDGESKIYPLGSTDCDESFVTYKKPIIKSEILDISRVRLITFKYN